MDSNVLDILWIIVSAALVLFMQAGFLCLETGLTRSKNNINVAMKNTVDFTVSMMAFWATGFALMFGGSWAGLVGAEGFFLRGVETPMEMVFFLFQALFCSTAVTVVSGAVAERLSFAAYVGLSLLVATLIYPVFGHWAWNGLDDPAMGGWLGKAGFVDWAGSSVVHSVGGWVALATLLIIGPRAGRFSADGSVNDISVASLPLSALGALILWFGWLGFNGGSTLSLTPDIAGIVANTCLGAAAGSVLALVIGWVRDGKPHVLPAINGILAGLVAVTANCHAVSPGAAVVIGGLGGAVAMGLASLLLRLRIDDAVGAVPVHLGGGIWGTVAVALFGDPESLGTGLGWTEQLEIQLTGVGACFAVAFVLPLGLLFVLNRVYPLRVSPEVEHIGLNVAEHGARTETFDFFRVMEEQAMSGDLSLRVEADPFTETGQIAARYNQVMDHLETAVARTRAIVSTSADAIFVADPADHAILSHNPVAETLFGLAGSDLEGRPLDALLPGLLIPGRDRAEGTREVIALRQDASRFPAELTLARAASPSGELLIATVRDITERRHAESALRESESRFRTIFNTAGLGMAVIDPEGRILDANPALARMLLGRVDEASRAEMIGHDLGPRVHPADFPTLNRAVRAKIADPASAEQKLDVRFRLPDGVTIWALVVLNQIRLERLSDQPLCIAILEDITERNRTREALRLSAMVFESTNEPIIVFNAGGQVEQVNQALLKTLGYAAREVRGLDLPQFCSVRYERAFYEDVFRTLEQSGRWQGEVLARCKSDELIPVWMSLSEVRDGDGQRTNTIAVLSDLSERKQREETVWRHANFDQTTGLPNRRLFLDRLSRAVAQAARSGEKVGLFFLDLDRFKAVNDTLGHRAGDALLAETAQRLIRGVRASDTVARIHGDEFTVILQNLSRSDQLSVVADTIIQMLAQPFNLPEGEANISTSIGIAVYPDDGTTPEDLLHHADAALYHAKEQGRANYQFFTKELNLRLARRNALESDLRRAIGAGDLFVLYQPQARIADGMIAGAEALVRWTRPNGGPVCPDEFIPLAEETGLIHALGEHVLAQVAADMRDLADQGLGHLDIAVNISPRQFHAKLGLEDTIERVLGEAGLSPSQLVVEITEGGIMADEEQSLAILKRLAEHGIRVALDDFGKGYSSLSRLKNLPIQALKLDREFIAGIPDDHRDCALATAMIRMARDLSIEVVAEGVETDAQLEFLKTLGCSKVQGYLIGRPTSLEHLIELAQAGGASTA
ncbi:ammonium transporter [Rhodospira trueperi]|uniref:Ammonium transporter, Amt family n=1 Tax=Rhodospira trueperi TaxID=69960 RepID=A0A1G7FQ47_9PROT|nr:ammonium transporter [Rhodospira trueperi]SDE77785.1 ammonium transporter, Amt family [Rhodospira trueperi]